MKCAQNSQEQERLCDPATVTSVGTAETTPPSRQRSGPLEEPHVVRTIAPCPLVCLALTMHLLVS